VERGNENVFAFSIKEKIFDKISILLPRDKVDYDIQLIPTFLKGYNKERMVDFYNKIRPDIPNEFKNSLCPKPNEEIENIVKEVKVKRVQTYKDRKNKKINGNL
jgi:uncharacterized protein with PIN domain